VTGLWEQLEAKQRRRLVQPIQISNPGEDQQIWMGVTAALQLEQNKPDDQRNDTVVANLQKQLDEAWDRVRSHYVDIELQSMPRPDWNAAMTEWQGDEGIDWAAALAPLVAACCVEPELQDPARWQALLEQDSWSEGDTNSLRMAVLALNVDGLDARLPKD
jgi:hypothetical protein